MDDDEITYDTRREAVTAAVAAVNMANSGATVFICRSDDIGCTGEEGGCDNCYVILPNDPRTVDEHLLALERRDT